MFTLFVILGIGCLLEVVFADKPNPIEWETEED
jgi:hypothetical protein